MTPDVMPNPDTPTDRRKGYRSHSPAERAAYGKAARKKTPRVALAHFSATSDRVDPIELLEEQAQNRLPALVPIRYGRMAASPFAFFRGAALPMVSDLSTLPNSGLHVQLCGDAHLMNFGAFGTPERRLVFDINDFDETSVGPFEWDVMRLCASVAVASRERGDDTATTEQAVLATASSYRAEMAKYAGMSTLDVWYSRFDVEVFLKQITKDLKPSRAQGINTSAVKKMRSRDSVKAAEQNTEMVDGLPRFISNPPLQIRGTETGLSGVSTQLGTLIDELHGRASIYRRTLSPERRHLFDEYRIVDVAMRVVGVGSVGTRCYILLLIGRDANDPLILQVKEANKSVLERYSVKSPFAHPGERVVIGQKLTQSASDLFLGWTDGHPPEGGTRSFYIRQFRDWKGSVEYADLQVPAFTYYVRTCAWAIAKAHARSGDQIAISAYVGNGNAFDRAMLSFALDYADQTVTDHAALIAAIDAGRIEARTGI